MPIGLGFRSRMLADSVRRARSELTPPSPPAHPGPHPRGISVSWTGARPGWAGLGDTSWRARYFQRHPDNDGSRGPYYVASECVLGGSREWGRSYLLGSSRGLVCGGWVPGSGLRAPGPGLRSSGQSGAIKLPRGGMWMLRGYLLVEFCFQGSVMRVLPGVQEGCASCEFRGGGVVYAKRGWGFGLRFVLWTCAPDRGCLMVWTDRRALHSVRSISLERVEDDVMVVFDTSICTNMDRFFNLERHGTT